VRCREQTCALWCRSSLKRWPTVDTEPARAHGFDRRFNDGRRGHGDTQLFESFTSTPQNTSNGPYHIASFQTKASVTNVRAPEVIPLVCRCIEIVVRSHFGKCEPIAAAYGITGKRFPRHLCPPRALLPHIAVPIRVWKLALSGPLQRPLQNLE
jgi:hypothetical protein